MARVEHFTPSACEFNCVLFPKFFELADEPSDDAGDTPIAEVVGGTAVVAEDVLAEQPSDSPDGALGSFARI